jgi:hypothetical protein
VSVDTINTCTSARPRRVTRLQVLPHVLGVHQAQDGVDAVEVRNLLVDEERLATGESNRVRASQPPLL